MKRAVCILVVLFLSACTLTNEQQRGVVGATAGGLIGSAIGKGKNKTAAIIGGSVLGGIIGMGLNKQQHGVKVITSCEQYESDGERAACERGASERNRAEQQRKENVAYNCARYGRC
jgi:uncharacterized protein YcfJ